MFKFETSDQKEVRRFRIAQFNGRTAIVRSAGSAVTGHVRSIVENKASVAAAWTITIIPGEPKPTLGLRPAPRTRCVMRDLSGTPDGASPTRAGFAPRSSAGAAC